jgi:nitrogen regulatory protein PII|tara:strand:+ start:113 stop:466 length:354 start_codon:yes stop_codon:yes gene_type:complete
MIKIEAIIRPERVNQVSVALQEVGCRGFHYQNVTGQGQQQGVEVFTGRGGRTATRATMPKTLIVTVVKDEMKEEVINAIISAASSPGEGAIGDGKIFVSFVEDIVRVRTKERGEGAL